MVNYRRTRELAAPEAAYIAGLIDGEGTVTLTRKHRNENRQVVVSISNTDRSLLDYVLDTVRAGKITNKRIASPHHTPSFTYAVQNRQALALLRQVQPFLKTYKAGRSALIIRSYLDLTPRNGKYTVARHEARKQFETEVLDIK